MGVRPRKLNVLTVVASGIPRPIYIKYAIRLSYSKSIIKLFVVDGMHTCFCCMIIKHNFIKIDYFVFSPKCLALASKTWLILPPSPPPHPPLSPHPTKTYSWRQVGKKVTTYMIL